MKHFSRNAKILVGLLALLLVIHTSPIGYAQPPPDNSNGVVVVPQQACGTITVGADPGHILIYADDLYLDATAQYSVKALDALGYSYTLAWCAPKAFDTLLTTGGPWEKVIIDQNWLGFGDFYGIGHPIWDDVNSYILGGGRAVVVAWDIDYYPTHPLWATLGASWSSVSFDPLNVYAWNPSHPIVLGANLPWTTWSDDWNRDAHRMNPTADGVAVAGFTATAQANQAAIIAGVSGRTVLASFLICEHRVSAETVALWKNMISFVQRPAAVGGTVMSPGPMTSFLAMLPWVLMAAVAVGAGAYAMRRRYASPILARTR